jgi:hypothetical protein
VAVASPPASTAATGTVARVTAASSDSPTGMKLAITTAFPAGANPLIGHVIFLMKERFDEVMRKAGAPIEGGTTPGKALQAFVAACAPPKDCKSIASATNQFYVGKATVDSTGKATLIAQVPPGAYFVFGSGRSNNGMLVWDLPTALKVGDNAATLSTANAELVH